MTSPGTNARKRRAGACPLDRVDRQVPVGSVYLVDARPHEAGERVEVDTRGDRPCRVGVAERVRGSMRDACRLQRGSPLAVRQVSSAGARRARRGRAAVCRAVPASRRPPRAPRAGSGTARSEREFLPTSFALPRRAERAHLRGGGRPAVSGSFVVDGGHAQLRQARSGCLGSSDDRVLALKLEYDFESPQRGQIVVFKAPATAAGCTLEVAERRRQATVRPTGREVHANKQGYISIRKPGSITRVRLNSRT